MGIMALLVILCSTFNRLFEKEVASRRELWY